MRGIYVHVPFCVRKCGYCDFYSVAGGEEERDRYPALVEREMDLLLRTFPGEAGVPADTVYFGGGATLRIFGDIGSYLLSGRCRTERETE